MNTPKTNRSIDPVNKIIEEFRKKNDLTASRSSFRYINLKEFGINNNIRLHNYLTNEIKIQLTIIPKIPK